MNIIIKLSHNITSVVCYLFWILFGLFICLLHLFVLALLVGAVFGSGVLILHVLSIGNVYYTSMVCIGLVAFVACIISECYPKTVPGK